MYLIAEIVSKETVEAHAKTASQKLAAAIDSARQGEWKPILDIGESLLLPAIGTILVMVLAYFAAKYLSRLAAAPIRKRVDETLGRFIGKLVFNLIMVGTLIGVLGTFGVNVTSFAAVLGAAGFAVGLAFQGTLSNFAAGVLLLVFRPFKVGDNVIVAGMNGKVNEIDLFTTTLDTPDNRRIIVPNSAISGNTIENTTYHLHRRIDVSVAIGFDCSLDETRNALTRAVHSLGDQILATEGRKPQVSMAQIGTGSIQWEIKVWSPADKVGDVREGLIVAIKREIDASGLRIPHPHFAVHLDPESLSGLLGSDQKQKPRMRSA